MMVSGGVGEEAGSAFGRGCRGPWCGTEMDVVLQPGPGLPQEWASFAYVYDGACDFVCVGGASEGIEEGGVRRFWGVGVGGV
jgi:hypothetical protein